MTPLQEAAIQAMSALEKYHYAAITANIHTQNLLNEGFTAFTALRQAIESELQDTPTSFVTVNQ